METEENPDRRIVDSLKDGPEPTEADETSRVIGGRRWLLVAILLLGGTAAALGLIFFRGSGSQEGRPVPAPAGEPVPFPSGESSPGTDPMPGDITITLTPDKLENAQIRIEAATALTGAAPVAGGVRTTGNVQANEYKETPVFPIAGGVVRRVNAELGDKVRVGQTLVTIFSTELADAQSEYLKMLAALEEHHKHHKRAFELVEIGAISREELEGATSEYKSAEANVESARQRLILLGMNSRQIDALKTSSQVSSLISVSAPASGTVISRDVNIGEVVEKSKELFRVVDLSTVWVIGQIYENDFRSVRIGTPAVITTNAYAGQSFRGRVSYIDPRVDPATRTSQVRVEVPNPGTMFRLGMFVDVILGGASETAPGGQPAVMVPHSAVQNIGSKRVVYLATDQPGRFVQREVDAGPEANGLVPIYRGVSAGARVVTEGSFLFRAESLKLNPAQVTSSSGLTPPSALPEPTEMAKGQQSPKEQVDPNMQTARIVLTSDGYRPASIRLRRNVLARLSFVRQVEVTCGTELVIAAYNIRRELPLNEPVVVEFMPDKPGEIIYTCGMGMIRGRIVVQ